MTNKTNSSLFLFGLLFVWVLFQSNAGGRPGTYANAPGDSGFCGDCHTSAGAGNIMLTGAPTSYSAGITYNMSITLNDLSASVGGFQIVATNGMNNTLVGSFTPGAGQTLNNVNRLVQSTPASFSGGSVSWPVSWTAPSSGAPSNVQFYFAGNAANGNGSNGVGDMGYSGSSAMIPLPVELLSFEANQEGKAVLLSWTTASEIGSDHFEIQRSTDGQTFSAIGKETASVSGYQSQSYEYIDEQVIIGKTNYYRLKMVDKDGQFSYSPVASLFGEGAAQSIRFYPNPLSKGETLTIELLEANRNNAVQVTLFNATGQAVYQDQLSADSWQIPTDRFSPGLYWLRLSDNAGMLSTERLILN